VTGRSRRPSKQQRGVERADRPHRGAKVPPLDRRDEIDRVT